MCKGEEQPWQWKKSMGKELNNEVTFSASCVLNAAIWAEFAVCHTTYLVVGVGSLMLCACMTIGRFKRKRISSWSEHFTLITTLLPSNSNPIQNFLMSKTLLILKWSIREWELPWLRV